MKILSTEFHVFAVEWEPDEIRWYADEKLYHVETPKTIAPNKWVFDHPFYIILNVCFFFYLLFVFFLQKNEFMNYYYFLFIFNEIMN